LLVPAAGAFANGTATVEVNGTGSGEIVNPGPANAHGFGVYDGTPELACAYTSPGPATGTCTDTLAKPEVEGEFFVAVPNPGSVFVSWTISEGVNGSEVFEEPGAVCRAGSEPLSGLEAGGEFNSRGSGARACGAFNESSTGHGVGEDVRLVATFDKAPPKAALTVFLAGKGTVQSAPTGLTCAGEECTGEFEEGAEVTLTATPETGYTFAGWVGCRHTGERTCEVTMSAAGEVTAVFLQNGEKGEPGTPGTPGTPGPKGEKGEPGIAGTNGSNGSNGEKGANGANGAAGAQGPAGPQGATGPAGRNAAVTCTVKQKGKKVKVTCTVKLAASASAAVARVRWRLTRSGRTYAHGTTARAARLHLNLGRLPRGRYLLHLQRSRGSTVIQIG
jgi:hypothetical protein